MAIQEYADHYTKGTKPTDPITGICGRIIRGSDPKDFETLTDDPLRKIVMLLGPDGLAEILGLSGYEQLIKIGYEPDYIVRKVVDEKKQFKLVIFPEGGLALPATWDNILPLIRKIYPDIASDIAQQIPILRSMGFELIEAVAECDFSEIDKAGTSHPKFMTLDRFKASDKGAIAVRMFLYFTLHLRELYSGDGYTYDDKGQKGLREYFIPNMPIKDLGDHIIIDIDVQVPSFKP